MHFPSPLFKGRLVKRYKRFLADIDLEEGGRVIAHCPNPGAIQGVTDPGTCVWVSKSQDSSRKLAFTWEIAENEGVYIGVNTLHPNTLVEEALREGKILELQGYDTVRREVRYGKNSRIDFLLSDPLTYVEVKNVHWKRGSDAAFPSAVTIRGTKHMQDLTEVVRQGHKAYIIYVVQRNDCKGFDLAHDIDPSYGAAAQAAFAEGVIPLVYACEVSPQGITLTHSIRYLGRLNE